jgi:hypothetical protein
MMATALYYPFIHFKDDDWLKLAALYWDRMARIVPRSYEERGDGGVVLERDSDITRQLADEVDFIRNLSPNEVTYPVSQLFERLLTRHAEELRAKYDVNKRWEWPADPVTSAYAQLRDPSLAYVHSTKLDAGLIGHLESESLAIAHPEGNQIWAGMHPRLAAVYMSALAEEVATANGHQPISDETLDHVAAAGWSLPRLAAALLDQPSLAEDAELLESKDAASDAVDQELRGALAMVSVRAVVPKDPKELSVTEIAHIRNDLGNELTRFQEFIDDFAAGLPHLTTNADPEAIADHLRLAHEKKVQPLMDELDGRLRSAGVDTALTAVSTSIATPAVLTLIPALSIPAAAVALSVIPVVLAKRRQTREVYEKSPVAYLYRLEKGLEPQTLLARVEERVRGFLTGV